jgi:hypothetical protein
MPDGTLMVCFTQATGPIDGRPQASKEVQKKLNWPPPGALGYDMTGLELKNVHLRSCDGGKTWKQASTDTFTSCMNGITGEAQTALPDGTVVRDVWGFYLPYDKDLPKTGYLQRSSDGTKTWGKPEIFLDPKKFAAWPKRLRIPRDGRLMVLMGVAHLPAGSHTREEFGKQVKPMLLVSADVKRPKAATSVREYWNRPKHPVLKSFPLREEVNKSGKNVILVVPALGPFAEAGKLENDGGMQGFLGRIVIRVSLRGRAVVEGWPR